MVLVLSTVSVIFHPHDRIPIPSPPPPSVPRPSSPEELWILPSHVCSFPVLAWTTGAGKLDEALHEIEVAAFKRSWVGFGRQDWRSLSILLAHMIGSMWVFCSSYSRGSGVLSLLPWALTDRVQGTYLTGGTAPLSSLHIPLPFSVGEVRRASFASRCFLCLKEKRGKCILLYTSIQHGVLCVCARARMIHLFLAFLFFLNFKLPKCYFSTSVKPT